eukprot:TRINITY_DN487_c0_g2_i4.p1 TRINITY_DN487_c0_g2~~TRINITY_DN487_c0_g2_i4.p1  ORF type:complete len:518 (-),score=79.44 TRINITY_DN487_c0_g2_i4:120-1673(-)
MKAVFLLLAFLFSLSVGQEDLAITLHGGTTQHNTYQLNGAGATFPAPVYSDWIYSFEIKGSNETTIVYNPTGSGDGKKQITTPLVDFTGSDSPLQPKDYDDASNLGLKMFPFVAGPVVLAYNLPPDSPSSSMVISRETLVGIYSNQIRFWNDSRIVADQVELSWISYLSNTSQHLLPVIRSEPSGTTDVFTNALSHFSSEWKSKYGRFDIFPESFSNGTVASFFLAPHGNYGVMNIVGATPYTIGYISLSVAKITEWNYYAKMKNKHGIVVAAEESSIASAVNDAVFDQYFNSDLVDTDGVSSYPILGFSYIIIQTIQQPYHDCGRRQALWRFFHYTLTDSSSWLRAISKGFASLPVNNSVSVLKLLANVSCNGTSLLRYSAVTQYDSAFIGIVSTILVIFTLVSAACWMRFVYHLFDRKCKLPYPMVVYGILICSSGIIGYAGVGMWLIVPTTSSVCMARVWLGSLGISIALSTNISRASQIQQLNSIMKSDNSTTRLQQVYLFLLFGILGFEYFF